jgi:hypothetical protein
MEKSKLAFKEGFAYAWALFWSPFVGAFDGMKAAVNQPKATNWKEFIVNDIRLYFAPLTGAIGGVIKALKGSHKNWH